MINPKEFRIGNYVMDKVSGEWMIVDDITPGRVGATILDRSKYPLAPGWQMAPIPITPELLRELGLPTFDYYRDIPAYFLSEDLDEQYFQCGSWFHIRTGTKEARVLNFQCKYLHQLQNLYFHLKDKEIEFKRIPTEISAE